MRHSRFITAGFAMIVFVCGAKAIFASEPVRTTTNGAIAIANLDQQIAQLRDEPEVVELLLIRSRFLGDYQALERASAIAEARSTTASDLLQRSRTRSAVHRFADALDDLKEAEKIGARRDSVVALRASILVATGHAAEAIRQLEHDVALNPGYASRSALAVAYAEVGRFADADRMYVRALNHLHTTSPFPYAWSYFARALMWTEQAGDRVRGEELYIQALAYLPEFVAANIHLAELEMARGDLTAAFGRLESIAASTDEPEAIALLGALHVRTGDANRGQRETAAARESFESLLSRNPLAFADHAAEFYLGLGSDPERAWKLSQLNLANRETGRAYRLAIKAAKATGRNREACALVVKGGIRPAQTDSNNCVDSGVRDSDGKRTIKY